MRALGWVLWRILCSALVLIFGAWALLGAVAQIILSVLRMAAEVWTLPDSDDD